MHVVVLIKEGKEDGARVQVSLSKPNSFHACGSLLVPALQSAISMLILTAALLTD